MDAHAARVALDLQARRLWQETKDAPRTPELQAALEAALDATNSGMGVVEAQAALDAVVGAPPVTDAPASDVGADAAAPDPAEDG